MCAVKKNYIKVFTVLLLLISLSFAYTADDFFVSLDKSQTWLGGGYAIYTLQNPTLTTTTLSKSAMPVSIASNSTATTSYNFFIEKNVSTTTQTYITVLQNCSYTDNKTGKPVNYACSYQKPDKVITTWATQWVPLNGLDSLSSSKATRVKLEMTWKLPSRQGGKFMVSRDWMPSLTVSGTTYTQSKWAWANASCGFMQQINYSNSWSNEAFNDFPFLLVLNSSVVNYSKTGFDDLQFYSADGKLLPKQLQLWNLTGNSFVWIRDNISIGTDYFEMYYNCTAPLTNDYTDVWKQGTYLGVWHLVGNVNDSSWYGMNATGVSATASWGPYGGGYNFDGTQSINYGTDSLYALSTNITVEALINPTAWGDWQWIVGRQAGSESTFQTLVVADGTIRSFRYDGTTDVNVFTSNKVGAGAWQYFGATFAGLGSYPHSYLNGTETVGTTPMGGDGYTGSLSTIIGARGDGFGHFAGNIAEVRIENATRSNKWMNASYLSIVHQFLSIGPETTYTPGSALAVSSIYPNSGITNKSGSMAFGYTPVWSLTNITLCQLYSNWSGAWGMIAQNATPVVNNTVNTFTANIGMNHSVWSVSCNSTDFNETFTANRTLNTSAYVFTVSPSSVYTTNSTSFNYTASNLNEVLATGSELWTNYSGTWTLLQANASKVLDGPNLESHNFPSTTRTVMWNIRLAFTDGTSLWGVNRSFTIFTTPPWSNTTVGDQQWGFRPDYNASVNFTSNSSLAIICNYSVNGVQVGTEVNATGNTSTYVFNMSDGLNNFTSTCVDWLGNSHVDITHQYAYVKHFILVVEDTGQNFTTADFANKTIRAISENSSKIFEFNNATANVSSVYYLWPGLDYIRVEKVYTAYPNDLLFTEMNLGLIDTESQVCVANTQQFYEIIFYSSSAQPVVVVNNLAKCYVLASYTRHAYSDALMAKAYTIKALYYLYTFTGNTKTYISSLDGSSALQVNIDVLQFTTRTKTYKLTTDEISVGKYDNHTYAIYYFNQRQDNTRIDLEILNASTSIFTYSDTVSPNNFTIYFDYSAYNLSNSVLKLRYTKHTATGTETKEILLTEMSGTQTLPAEVAFLFAAVLMFFSLTLTAARHTFGYFGIFASLLALIITTLTIATAEIRLLQAALAIILVFQIMVMRQENAGVM